MTSAYEPIVPSEAKVLKPKREARLNKPGPAAIFMFGWLAALWIIEIVDVAMNNRLDQYGIHPRTLAGLWQIFTAPFIHFGWGHIAANSIPFFILGFLVLIGGTGRWLISSVLVLIFSGLGAWALSPSHAVVAGASGLVFGWLTYLLARAVLSRSIGQIAIAVIVFVVYGSVLWGMLPTTTTGVSWQAHVGGAVGGVLAAWILHRRDKPAKPKRVVEGSTL